MSFGLGLDLLPRRVLDFGFRVYGLARFGVWVGLIIFGIVSVWVNAGLL